MNSTASRLIDTILSPDPRVRNLALEFVLEGASKDALLATIRDLDDFRRKEKNLYARVRALFFLYAICRFHLPPLLADAGTSPIPGSVRELLMDRRFAEAIDELGEAIRREGINDGLASALASSYYQLGLQNLADQVRRSVRQVRGNQWMFRCGHPENHPLRIRRELLARNQDQPYPVLHEETAVRMDLSHSAWSDIFFLGMDYPEGARVLNVSINLAVEGRDLEPQPPVSAALRVIDEPLIRLTSIDLGATADISSLEELFHFAKDYLGLLKAGLIASGVIPIGMEGSGAGLVDILRRLVGPGRGIELVSMVNNIPKGSRLAVSTNLLGSIISVCMRATGQTRNLEGALEESERRTVASRAILGEWLGGSGGGWQDSGGVWPGIKIISGAAATPGDPEYGVSRGRLLPAHRILPESEISDETRRKLSESLVLVHGGMAQNVGPILEMVTEKYLLRCAAEWRARLDGARLFDEILDALRKGDIRSLGALTTRQFYEILQTIVPWATSLFTERIIERARAAYGEDFWGFWMLGGMSGGGMGFIFAPHRAAEARVGMQEILSRTKRELEHALPFAMEPVVYRFRLNENGSFARLLTGSGALMPPEYYPLVIPSVVRADPRSLPDARRAEVALYGQLAAQSSGFRATIEPLLKNLLPGSQSRSERGGDSLDDLLQRYGFDREAHERIRSDLQGGRTGLAQNRLPVSTTIEDVHPGDIFSAARDAGSAEFQEGSRALAAGELAVISLAAGAGSRWTEGAGVVKALHPFAKLLGRHHNFLEVHLSKTRRTGDEHGVEPLHVFTTSYLTHDPVADFLFSTPVLPSREKPILSFGKSIGLRMIPMVRDLRFAHEELRQQVLDERKQKMRESAHQALQEWARACGEGSDYRDNLPAQCLHPVGHWYEIPNLLLNGTLAEMLSRRPTLKTLLLHNIDTLGANPDPALLGLHRLRGGDLTYEVIPRRIEDVGGGLARVNGRTRLVEGMALPREEDEYRLSFYNTLTTWIEVDALLRIFGLTRRDLLDGKIVLEAVRSTAARLPTYITLKEVKKRWGHGQEDILPVAQFEKLWGDMTCLPDVNSQFVVVPRVRGQQLKAQAQLDGWLRDGSAAYIESLMAR